VIEMHEVVRAEALAAYRLHVCFDDGTEGTIDLSPLVGKGVFEAWLDPARFAEVFVDPDTGAPSWQGGIDLCPESLYEEIVQGGSAAPRARGVAESSE
jgi:hypothetical protein